MNPAIVIPSYWAWSDEQTEIGELGVYDYVTPVNKPLPELELCLSSLDKVRGVLRVIVLIVSRPDCAASARARVEGICRMHPGLNPLVVGEEEGRLMMRVVNDIAPNLPGELVSLRGYGAIHNMGLAVAATLGHDVVVFLDDDNVVLDKDFLLKAVYGLGQKTRQGLTILAKTGYYVNRENSPYASLEKPAWSEVRWSKRVRFNEMMQRLLNGTRISRATSICGGCFAVSAHAYTRVAFDSVITRGEDLDYLCNLRMNGIDVWADNEWYVKHTPPEIPSAAARFLQEVYRWTYEYKKIAACNATIGKRTVSPDSLEPYPGDWVSPKVERRITETALRRAIVGPERLEYLKILLFEHSRARAWADRQTQRYLALQTYWPYIIAALWNNRLLARQLTKMGTARLEWLGPTEGDE